MAWERGSQNLICEKRSHLRDIAFTCYHREIEQVICQGLGQILDRFKAIAIEIKRQLAMAKVMTSCRISDDVHGAAC